MLILRKIVLILVLGLLALFIQGTLLKSLEPAFMIVPNLFLVLVCFLAFYEVSVLGAVLAFVLGLELDIASNLLLGPWAASFIAVYGMLSSISQRVFVESVVAVFLGVLCSCILATFIYLVIVFQFQPTVGNLLSYSLTLMVEALLTAVLAPLIFAGLKVFLLPRSSASSSRA